VLSRTPEDGKSGVCEGMAVTAISAARSVCFIISMLVSYELGVVESDSLAVRRVRLRKCLMVNVTVGN
jgi:hypothetical protein